MGSLPDLTERSRSHSVRPATRTISDPHRHHAVIPQIPVGNFCKKEWLWRKSKTPTKMPQLVSNRRRESVASSLGATSVRRLITRPPQKLPKPIIIRFSLLCVASGLCSTVILPFTAFAGAEAGATPLAIMHAVAAIIAPFSPIVLQRTGTRAVVAAAHVLVGILLLAHSIATPLAILLVLYALCGLMLSPMQLALAASATSFAQAAGDELKRKVMLRRALRALKAAQDVGLVFGSSMLGLALIIWPEDLLPLLQLPTRLQNYSTPGWPPSEDDLAEEDFEWYGVCIGGWSEAWRALCGAGALQAIAAVTLSMAAARGRRGALAAGGAAAHASLLLALLRWRAARTDLALPTVAAVGIAHSARAQDEARSTSSHLAKERP
ncbi:unnamed protein product [Leptidea sinapis]|uniref:Uncharacterized protein n=1 Tax=Leptidea sinapis TaxID=189913 RepID=A0A5E4QKG1_9NEOP|nr:unnamed protein product [Leptidea sinapis]